MGNYVDNFSTVCDAQRDSSSLDCNVLGEGIANASLCDVVQAEAATELNTLSTITCNNGTCSEQFNFVYRCVDALNFCEESSGGEKVMKNPSELMANSLCEAQLGFPQLGTRLCASEPTLDVPSSCPTNFFYSVRRMVPTASSICWVPVYLRSSASRSNCPGFYVRRTMIQVLRRSLGF